MLERGESCSSLITINQDNWLISRRTIALIDPFLQLDMSPYLIVPHPYRGQCWIHYLNQDKFSSHMPICIKQMLCGYKFKVYAIKDVHVVNTKNQIFPLKLFLKLFSFFKKDSTLPIWMPRGRILIKNIRPK